MRMQFNENWDGVHRYNIEEAAQTTIGKYRFTPFVEGSIKGWTISIQGMGQVGYIQEPAKKNTKTTFSPYKVYRTKSASSPWELKMSALPGTENRIVSDREIRFAPRQLLKAIAMWMDQHGKVMTEEGYAATKEKKINEKLIGKQKNIDMNKDGKLTKKDFDILQAIRREAEKKKSSKSEETVKEGDAEISEAMNHFTELDKAAKDIVDIVKAMPKNAVGYSPVQADLLKVANSLYLENNRMKDFFDGLIMSLEGINRKVGSPSKHGNMEIMREMDMVIRELKKYKK